MQSSTRPNADEKFSRGSEQKTDEFDGRAGLPFTRYDYMHHLIIGLIVRSAKVCLLPSLPAIVRHCPLRTNFCPPMSALIVDYGGLFLVCSSPQFSAILRRCPPISGGIFQSAILCRFPHSCAVFRSKILEISPPDIGGNWRTTADFGGMREFQ